MVACEKKAPMGEIIAFQCYVDCKSEVRAPSFGLRRYYSLQLFSFHTILLLFLLAFCVVSHTHTQIQRPNGILQFYSEA